MSQLGFDACWAESVYGERLLEGLECKGDGLHQDALGSVLYAWCRQAWWEEKCRPSVECRRGFDCRGGG